VDSLNHKPLVIGITSLSHASASGEFISANGPLRLAENDSRKSEHNFQTHKARFGGGLHAAVPSVATEPVTEQNH